MLFVALIQSNEGFDCHIPIRLKLPGAEVGGTVRCPA